MGLKKRVLFVVAVIGLAAVGYGHAESPGPESVGSSAQQADDLYQLAIPINVSVLTNESLAILTGKSTGATTIQCAPGPYEFQHNAVIVDPGGGSATQRTELVVFQPTEEPARPGTRFRLLGDGAPCNADYKLYTGKVE